LVDLGERPVAASSAVILVVLSKHGHGPRKLSNVVGLIPSCLQTRQYLQALYAHPEWFQSIFRRDLV